MITPDPFVRLISLRSGDTGEAFIRPVKSTSDGIASSVIVFSVEIYDVLGSANKIPIYFSQSEALCISELMCYFDFPTIKTEVLGKGEFIKLYLGSDQKVGLVTERPKTKTKAKRPITIVHEPGNTNDTFDFLTQAIERVVAQGDANEILGIVYNGDQEKYAQFCDALKFAIESVLLDRQN